MTNEATLFDKYASEVFAGIVDKGAFSQLYKMRP